MEYDFNPRSPKGATYVQVVTRRVQKFQSTLPEGSDSVEG